MKQFRNAAFAISALAVALFAADSPFAGTWKLNASKSKLEGSGLGSASTVKIESETNGLKIDVDATDDKGQPVKFSYSATLDGKPNSVSGAPNVDKVMFRSVNAHTINATGEKGGKVVYTDRRTVSGDGKTMTISRNGTNAEGKKFHATMVFDKQ